MTGAVPLLLVLDLIGAFVFALNGALTAVRVADLDVVGVVVLATMTALGGGILRDVILDDLPPATFSDWRYLAVATLGGILVTCLGHRLERLRTPITVLDAAGLSLFAVTGASKALEFGLGPVQAVLLGCLTGVGGGTLRDVLIRQVPTVLTSELYAIPALLAAAIVVLASAADLYGPAAALGAAALCFGVRLLGVRYALNAPGPRTP